MNVEFQSPSFLKPGQDKEGKEMRLGQSSVLDHLAHVGPGSAIISGGVTWSADQTNENRCST